jgi:hypothetical protein
MSDFDKFFAEKLDGESAFPKREKNWRRLADRLNAFDAGGREIAQPRLRLWQSLAVAALVAAGFLVWKNVAAKRENERLRQEIAALKIEAANQGNPLRLPETAAQKVGTIGATAPENRAQIAPSNAPTDSPTPFARQKNTRSKQVEKTRSKAAPQAENLSNPSLNPSFSTINDIFTASKPNPQAENLVEKPAPAPALESAAMAASTPPALGAAPHAITAAIDSARAASSAPDSTQASPVAPIVEAAAPPEMPTALPSPVVTPVHNKNYRFRLGVQATAGFAQPAQSGVSPLLGQGLVAEFRVSRDLWLSGSADWLHFEVCTQDFKPRFHPPHDSLPRPPNMGGGGGSGPPLPRLTRVESDQRQQHFALGLRYALPVRWWARPSLRLAHEWVHTSPTRVVYQFKEEGMGGGPNGGPPRPPKFAAENFDSQWLNNRWRLGLGLERETPRWVFSVSADYSKSLAATVPSFDALFVRAGAQHRF